MTAICIAAVLVLIAQHMERVKPYRKRVNHFETTKTAR